MEFVRCHLRVAILAIASAPKWQIFPTVKKLWHWLARRKGSCHHEEKSASENLSDGRGRLTSVYQYHPSQMGRLILVTWQRPISKTICSMFERKITAELISSTIPQLGCKLNHNEFVSTYRYQRRQITWALNGIRFHWDTRIKYDEISPQVGKSPVRRARHKSRGAQDVWPGSNQVRLGRSKNEKQDQFCIHELWFSKLNNGPGPYCTILPSIKPAYFE